jgi:drug/metabolite transporter superfamily protein YnfA
VASTNSYAFLGWADSRNADEVTQTQDAFGTVAQFAPLPTTSNTVAPKIAAAFGGVLVAGIILLVVMQFRRRSETPLATSSGKQPVTSR